MIFAFDDTVSRLGAALAAALPGVDAQRRMAPRPRRNWRPGEIPEHVRDAAAVLLVYPVDGQATLALTQRAEALRSHPGQVSLPGGRLEPGENAIAAALREAHEEVGANPALVTPIGALTALHIPVSGHLLHPIVAASPARPDFVPHDGEVAKLIEVPLRVLAAPTTRELRTWVYEGATFTVPGFAVDDVFIWGATAMVLAEFLALLAIDVTLDD
jgi:8-oxo-dGTP pyrophosphatase MutT (NUDIX family)